LVGIIGAPNKGKSTLFSAMTMNDVAIADYPFTTINPNLGVSYATRECVEKSLGVKCKPRNSLCVNGIRKLPVNLIDVAGLVEGAHEGKGMGNQFLNDLSASDALMVVVDASGKTDATGNRCDDCDPVNDVKMVMNELTEWLSSIIKRHMNVISKAPNGVEALQQVLTGFKVTKEGIEKAAEQAYLPTSGINWPDDDIRTFAAALLKNTKPILIVANKCDAKNSEVSVERLRKEYGNDNVVACSAAIELALRKAESQGLIDYMPGARDFRIIKTASKEQSDALSYMLGFISSRGTGVQEILNHVVFKLLDNIVVYPVEDESKYTDHFGNVLPDAILIKEGSTAQELAGRIHTDLAKGMLYAIDARSKMRLAKDYALKDGDVIKIVSAAK
jgi:ribosome-binding ATPase YchF (GTP1/OBG family)